VTSEPANHGIKKHSLDNAGDYRVLLTLRLQRLMRYPYISIEISIAIISKIVTSH